MRTREEINTDYNMTSLKLGHLTAQLHLRDTETSMMQADQDKELARVDELVSELKALEAAERVIDQAGA